ncbi:MAG: substrate-binding domain-containing protein [Deltaproteobacteria bacterium]|nr:substrate-binding domain-containing protein [Deltaproteobacteria bacterium]
MNILHVMIATAFLSAPFVPANADEIRIEGGAAAISTVFSPIKEAYESSTGDKVTIVLSNPAKALISLEKGSVDMASLNLLSFDDAIGKAKAQGVAIDPASLSRTEVATSSLLVFLNKSNKISKLDKEQLKAIFTGKVTNWRDVGGDDGEITVYWGKETPYLNKLFTKTILDGEKVTAKAKPAGDHFQLREIILANPGAIVINTSGLITPATKVPDIPPMKLPILVFTKGEPSAKVLKLLKYYKDEFGYMDE